MSDREKLISLMTEHGELTPEALRLMEGSKKFNHPVTGEIMLLCATKDQLEPDELKKKYHDLKNKLQKIIKDFPKNYKFSESYTHVDAIRAMSILAADAGELEQAQLYLEMVSTAFPKKKSHLAHLQNSFQIIQYSSHFIDDYKKMALLDLQTELGSLFLKQGKRKDAKKNLKLTNELYQSVRLLKEDEKKRFIKYCEDRGMPSFELHLQLQHVSLLRNYEQYYKMIDDTEKYVHNGLLVLKYEHKYNLMEALNWIEHTVDLTPPCCELHAYRQSHYLLRAAEAMLKPLKESYAVPSLPNISKLNQIRFLSGRIKLGFAQHGLFLLYQTKNVNFLVEKVKKGLRLTQEEAHDMQKDIKLTEFDELNVPAGDHKFDGLLQDFDEIREVYKKVKDWMAEVNKTFTMDEKKMYEYDVISQKLRELLNAYPFLDGIR